MIWSGPVDLAKPAAEVAATKDLLLLLVQHLNFPTVDRQEIGVVPYPLLCRSLLGKFKSMSVVTLLHWNRGGTSSISIPGPSCIGSSKLLGQNLPDLFQLYLKGNFTLFLFKLRNQTHRYGNTQCTFTISFQGGVHFNVTSVTTQNFTKSRTKKKTKQKKPVSQLKQL